MTLVSTLIAECRREYADVAKSTSVSRAGNASVNLFNLGKHPVMESSYQIYLSGALKSEGSDYSIDLDSGDLQMSVTPGNGIIVKANHKYAEWRDKNWLEAINNGLEELNARGFFRQVARVSAPFQISAGIQKYNGPSACIDLYEFLVSDNSTTSGNFIKPMVNWSYQSDANNLILGNKPISRNYAKISYLRTLQRYTAVSATIDVPATWEPLVKKYAGAAFFGSLAAKIAKQGNANIDEGHFSFTNLRARSRDLMDEFKDAAARKKPTRPAKDFGFFFPEGGVA